MFIGILGKDGEKSAVGLGFASKSRGRRALCRADHAGGSAHTRRGDDRCSGIAAICPQMGAMRGGDTAAARWSAGCDVVAP